MNKENLQTAYDLFISRIFMKKRGEKRKKKPDREVNRQKAYFMLCKSLYFWKFSVIWVETEDWNFSAKVLSDPKNAVQIAEMVLITLNLYK